MILAGHQARGSRQARHHQRHRAGVTARIAELIEDVAAPTLDGPVDHHRAGVILADGDPSGGSAARGRRRRAAGATLSADAFDTGRARAPAGAAVRGIAARRDAEPAAENLARRARGALGAEARQPTPAGILAGPAIRDVARQRNAGAAAERLTRRARNAGTAHAPLAGRTGVPARPAVRGVTAHVGAGTQ